MLTRVLKSNQGSAMLSMATSLCFLSTLVAATTFTKTSEHLKHNQAIINSEEGFYASEMAANSSKYEMELEILNPHQWPELSGAQQSSGWWVLAADLTGE